MKLSVRCACPNELLTPGRTKTFCVAMRLPVTQLPMRRPTMPGDTIPVTLTETLANDLSMT